MGKSLFGQSPHGDNLSIDCEECHSPDDWGVNLNQLKFKHASTGFELIGEHIVTDCRSCHTNLVFNLASPQCFSCHQDIHQNTVGSDCQECHSPNSWVVKDIREIHERSRFPLLGPHLAADCIQCHNNFQNLYFEELAVDCYSCHQNEYNATTSPDHAAAGFSTQCEDCHSIVSNNWTAQNINHDFFPLIGGHRIENCFSCHEQGGSYSGLSTDCYSCHRNDYEQVQDPNHLAGNFPLDCSQCHSINGWEPANFNHNLTQFPLTGAHSSVDCINCHSQTYSGTPAICVECHQDNFNATVNPNHGVLGISTDCQTCHSTSAWIPSSFNHSNTGLELIGEHLIAECSSCHEGTTTGLSQECIACHQEDFNQSMNPNHAALSIPTDCQTCHTPTGNWEPASFPIHNNYYELIGAHAVIANDCMTCHNDNYNITPNTCIGCHQTEYDNTNNPSHVAANFPTQCESCHSQNAWSPATFDHDNQYFPIYSGSHREKWDACSECHSSPTNFTVFSCIDCHEHNQADTDEDHQGVNGYLYNSEACFACHPTGDEGGAFNHSLSNFPLTGSHTAVECQQCHQQGYSGTSTICYDCHQTNYNSSTNPNHQTLLLSTNCNECHTTYAGWEPALFPQHNQFFEFTGRHTDISNDCSSCHSGNYSTTSSECSNCHQDNYQTTQNPDHTAIGLSVDCQSCHSAAAWSPSTFNHTSTGFELLGQHSSTICSSCHLSSAPLNPECISCHQDDYNIAPDHASQNFPTTCQMCHNSAAWAQVNFDHQTTAFPLTGSHVSVSCSNCHQSVFTGTPTECFACHDNSYNNAVNPNHAALSIPTDCQTCHTTNPGWTPASFPIHINYYELIGAHAAIANDCMTCHNNNYSTTPNTCVGCHQTEYNNTNNPSHIAANFPTQCESCHSQNAWSPATFDHDNQYFPIYSGSHREKWDACSDCHTNPSNFTVFSCIDCHEHNQNDTDNDHEGVNGYLYNSEACFSCHPTGDEGGAFNHSLSNFPLTGSHITVECQQCHQQSYSGTSTICYDCHQTNYNSSTNPDHSAIGLSTDCNSCHLASGWKPSSFNHNSTGFELAGGHSSISCSSCHESSAPLNAECINCHQEDYNIATDHTSQNFPTNCGMCHNSIAWNQSTFNHQNTAFPLTGGHTSVNCNSCHQSGFTGTTTVCSECHQSDYSNSTNPSHTALSLSTNCESCHTTNSGWEPASFSVHNNYYQLLGAHASIADNCVTCHSSNYSSTPNTCYGCHQADYNSTNNPPHQSSGFSQECETCHTQSAWIPATFDHDNQFFPIYSGKHREAWDQCSDCHTNTSNFSIFSCIDCHEHSQTKTDDDHSEVNDYIYSSEACYNCHPNGDEGLVEKFNIKIVN